MFNKKLKKEVEILETAIIRLRTRFEGHQKISQIKDRQHNKELVRLNCLIFELAECMGIKRENISESSLWVAEDE